MHSGIDSFCGIREFHSAEALCEPPRGDDSTVPLNTRSGLGHARFAGPQESGLRW